jgi:diaminopimelate epimerase
MISIPFSKYSGGGNDFILIDHRNASFSSENPGLIQKLCHRHQGIGADGVIFLENSQCCDARMRIFNADGYEAEMCGNGLRCLARFMIELGFPTRCYTIETMQRMLTVEMREQKVKASMGPPADMQWDIPLSIQEKTYTLHYLDTGVPHAILFVDNVDSQPVQFLAPLIRSHPRFAPKGTNVDFVQVVSPHTISIRTYERGVEGETEACGTGACASAVAAAIKKQLVPPIEVITRSKETLSIDFRIDSLGNVQEVSQMGPANKTFQGVFFTEKGTL